ncbi:hypothetical protein P3T24_002080, partial [Paraburkholderia sp. GAS33]|uniref:hypothetical protein n=1 Tax=Paraburkholderia sp. GAS33 TaxID=3035130 RepID=UPI003D1FC397
TRLLRFATVIVAPVTGSLLPNDRLHKTIYTLAACGAPVWRLTQTRAPQAQQPAEGKNQTYPRTL